VAAGDVVAAGATGAVVAKRLPRVRVRSVDIEEIRQNDYDLQPHRYVHGETDSRNSLADTPSARLESLQRELDELTERAKRTRRNVDARLKALHDSAHRQWREVFLGDICDIRAGPGTVDRERGVPVQGWTSLVLPRNIKRGYLSHAELDTARPETSAKLANYRLCPGDIVCARSGNPGTRPMLGHPTARAPVD
jgi:type I restriction enzyme M protein